MTTKGYWWNRDAGNFANCWGSRIHFIRPMLYNSKSNCWVFATLQNLQESSSLSYTPCTLTRDDRKVRSGKLSMHENMFQCYSMLIKHIEGCPADRSTVVWLVSRPFKDSEGGGGGDRVLCVTKQGLHPQLRFYSKAVLSTQIKKPILIQVN